MVAVWQYHSRPIIRRQSVLILQDLLTFLLPPPFTTEHKLMKVASELMNKRIGLSQSIDLIVKPKLG